MTWIRACELKPGDIFLLAGHSCELQVMFIREGRIYYRYYKSGGYRESMGAKSREIVQFIKTKADVLEEKKQEKSYYRQASYARLR